MMTKQGILCLFAITLAACGGPPAKERGESALAPQPDASSAPQILSVVNEASEFEDISVADQEWILLITDSDPIVRQEAIDALVDTEVLSNVGLLELALSDPHPGVREAAQEALEELGVFDTRD